MTEATLTTLPNTATVDEAVEVITRDGGVIIEDFLGAEDLAGLAEDLDRVLSRIPDGEDPEFAGTLTRRAGAIFARSLHTQAVALHPLYLNVARNILQRPIDIWIGQKRTPIVPTIRIGVTQAIRIAPGQGSQPLHRDDLVFLWRHPQYGREARVQIMVAISDFTEANGGTKVIPASHLWDDDRMPTDEEAISTVMKAGSALIFIGSTYHGGGQNTTDQARTGLTLAYDLGVLRQEENQYLSVPVSVIKQYPEELQRLIGWDAGENYMGYVELDGKMSDPHLLLERDDYLVATDGIDQMGAAVG